MLPTDPFCGGLVPGLGGIRKIRLAAAGRGKSGWFRVIYDYAAAHLPMLALLSDAKNERDDISPDQRKTMWAIIATHKANRPRAVR